MCIRDRSTSQFIAIFTLIAGIILVIVSQMLANKGIKAFMVGPNGTALQEETAAAEAEKSVPGAENADDKDPETDDTAEQEKEAAPEDAGEASEKE